MNDSPALPRLQSRPADSHKGDYGRALLVGGSRGMCGAIALAATAALRSAGLVTVATFDHCADLVAALQPCYMTLPLRTDAHHRLVATARDRSKRRRSIAWRAVPDWDVPATLWNWSRGCTATCRNPWSWMPTASVPWPPQEWIWQLTLGRGP